MSSGKRSGTLCTPLREKLTRRYPSNSWVLQGEPMQ
jgi:hypothetical protein